MPHSEERKSGTEFSGIIFQFARKNSIHTKMFNWKEVLKKFSENHCYYGKSFPSYTKSYSFLTIIIHLSSSHPSKNSITVITLLLVFDYLNIGNKKSKNVHHWYWLKSMIIEHIGVNFIMSLSTHFKFTSCGSQSVTCFHNIIYHISQMKVLK